MERKKGKKNPTGTVAHTYNLSYLRGIDKEVHSLRPAPAKKFTRPHLNQ
jgi:hypothetical protein